MPRLVDRMLAAAHVTAAGAVVLGASAGAWWLARVLGSRAAYLMVYGAVLAMAVSWFASRRRLAMAVERSKLPSRMREGQVGEVTLTVTPSKRGSALILREDLPPALGRPVELAVASLSPGEPVEHGYAFTPSLRGVYDVGPLTAEWTDPFGLTTQRQHLLDATQVIVHPATEGVDDRILARMWEDPPVRPPVSKPWPTGFEFYGMRDYVPGDDLRRVVWAAVAKTGRMLVRESEQGITDRVSVFLDNGRAHHSKGVPSATFELAVRVAASVVKKHIEDGFSVSLSTNDTRLAHAVRGKPAALGLLDHLARVSLSPTPLNAVGEMLLADARAGSHFVVITTHVDKDTTNRLRMAIERGASVTVGKIVWDETDPLSLARAAGLGARVVQIPLDSSLSGAFAHQVGGGFR